MNKKREKKYFKSRTEVILSIMLIIVILLAIVVVLFIGARNKQCDSKHKEHIYMKNREIISELSDIENCHLCGNSEQSLMGYYRKFDTLGIIGLDEWNVLDLRLKTYDEDGKEILEDNGNNTVFGNTDAVQYVIDSIPTRGVAEAEITFRKNGINAEFLQNHLCQSCCEKVLNTVNGDEETVPLCIVDFETLEVFSLQMQKGTYFVRDYRVEVEREESKVNVQVYYLPERNVE